VVPLKKPEEKRGWETVERKEGGVKIPLSFTLAGGRETSTKNSAAREKSVRIYIFVDTIAKERPW